MHRVLGIAAAAFAGLLLSGCAKTMWINPSVTNDVAQSDLLQCQYEAQLGTPDTSSGRGLGNAMGDGIAQGLRINELRSMCMNLRGYTLQSVK